ncbi:hypothetical protein BE21_54195 [Sorangium cellulosum]|uniref:Group II intron maturase-specific domain-containing protein n=1 Tax=Sorangium cellulosum TaxID=56 RepID=A0A150TDV0_SORCE|nr:hypothetical protein BE21_54195 [Sorangium cellulosum]
MLEPIFEADFRPSSYGFRPRRSATQALETLRKLGARGGNHVLDADIRDYFGSIDLRKRMSGPIWESSRRRVYFLQRWPSQRSMKRVRQRVKELTGRARNGVKDVRVLIRDLNPVLRGWGNDFRTGNAADKFNQIDDDVWRRLHRFLVKRKGRHLHAGEVEGWTSDFFVEGHGLHRLRGTIQYPEAA